MTKTIFLIAGQDGAGKSTLGARLAAQLGNAQLLTFADSLRNMISQDLELPLADVYEKPTPPEIRNALRKEASRYASELGQNVFAKATINSIITDVPFVIIHDTRYAVEYLELFKYCVSNSIRLTTVFVGDAPTEDHPCYTEPSFRELPHLMRVSDYQVPRRSEHLEKIISNLVRNCV